MSLLEMTLPSRAALSTSASPAARKTQWILQLTSAKVAVLDETDSGLDIDALRVAKGVNSLEGPTAPLWS